MSCPWSHREGVADSEREAKSPGASQYPLPLTSQPGAPRLLKAKDHLPGLAKPSCSRYPTSDEAENQGRGPQVPEWEPSSRASLATPAPPPPGPLGCCPHPVDTKSIKQADSMVPISHPDTPGTISSYVPHRHLPDKLPPSKTAGGVPHAAHFAGTTTSGGNKHLPRCLHASGQAPDLPAQQP